MIPYFLVLAGTLARLIPHPPNFTPVTAIALYSGAHCDRKLAIVIPLAVMVLSDIVLGFHPWMLWVYGSFAVIVCLGFWLKTHQGWGSLTAATLIASLFFYVVTCYGSWHAGGVLGKTFQQDLIISLPFYRNMLTGDCIYVGIFFGLHRALRLFTLNKPALSKLMFQPGS